MTRKAQHAPGPWLIAGERRNQYSIPVYDIRSKGSTEEIASVTGIDATEARANANLVKAAPNALQACKAALSAFRINPELQVKHARCFTMLLNAVSLAETGGIGSDGNLTVGSADREIVC